MIGNSWFTMAFTGYLWCVISMILVLPFPESPRLLLAQGKLQEFKKALDMLASWNNCKINWDQFDLEERINSSVKDNQDKTIIDLDENEKYQIKPKMTQSKSTENLSQVENEPKQGALQKIK